MSHGAILATNVSSWSAALTFVGNNEYPSYNCFDADTTNDGNKIIGNNQINHTKNTQLCKPKQTADNGLETVLY